MRGSDSFWALRAVAVPRANAHTASAAAPRFRDNTVVILRFSHSAPALRHAGADAAAIRWRILALSGAAGLPLFSNEAYVYAPWTKVQRNTLRAILHRRVPQRIGRYRSAGPTIPRPNTPSGTDCSSGRLRSFRIGPCRRSMRESRRWGSDRAVSRALRGSISALN